MFANYPIRSLLLVAAAAAGSLSLGACSSVGDATRSVLQTITPYTVEVVQGNFVSKQQVAALRPGMTRQQVREIMGTPLLTDVFHSDRWDYAFTIRRTGVKPQQRHLTLFFDGEYLQRFEGDEMPSEEEFVAALDTRRKTGKVPRLDATDTELKKHKLDKKEDAQAEPVQPSLPASYPPLER